MSVSSPLPCGGYWLSAGRALRDVRMITFAALRWRCAWCCARLPSPSPRACTFPSRSCPAPWAPWCAARTWRFCPARPAMCWATWQPRAAGRFYPLFTLVAMLECLLYALFLFRAPLRVWRAAAAKLSVNVVCNILLTPVLLSWMYGQAIRVYLATRVVKNLLLFPLEAALLYLLLRAALPALARLGFRGR